jgi:hypothetical protein
MGMTALRTTGHNYAAARVECNCCTIAALL